MEEKPGMKVGQGGACCTAPVGQGAGMYPRGSGSSLLAAFSGCSAAQACPASRCSSYKETSPAGGGAQGTLELAAAQRAGKQCGGAGRQAQQAAVSI